MALRPKVKSDKQSPFEVIESQATSALIVLSILLCVTFLMFTTLLVVSNRAPSFMNGVPHETPTSKTSETRSERSDTRVYDNRVRRESDEPQVIREDGLSEAVNSL